ncbi:MAG: YkgJ family cysteine cluster protein [Promethearchaeota archaeon]
MKNNSDNNDKKIREEMCALCGGACCREIEVPFGFKTPDIIKWISIHEDVEIIEKKIHIKTQCKYLQDGRCLVYNDPKKRPRLCYEFRVGNRNCLKYIRKYCGEKEKDELINMAKLLSKN